MKRALAIIITLIALSALVFPVSASTVNAQYYPYFNILEVVKDTSVTIQVFTFPANDNLQVTMGNYGTYGVGGVVVETSNSGSSGSFTATYSIPSSLAGLNKIAIRIQSPTSGYYAYNWFYNNPSTPPSTTPPSTTPIPGYSGYPTFSIESVVMDETVTIKTSNLPPNDTYNVTMGDYGTQGIGGINVGNTNSGTGGTLTLTYDIPDSLAGKSKIAIRMQSPKTGYFAYNWFYNSTGSAAPTASPQPQPTTTPVPPSYPTFTISAVVRDQTVTISGINFPANDTFTAMMGPYGSQGLGGTNVGNTSTGAGGSLTATYNIPSSLSGASKIAIRLQSPTSGYYAYNWFYNSTTP
jgi:hypothetical protein